MWLRLLYMYTCGKKMCEHAVLTMYMSNTYCLSKWSRSSPQREEDHPTRPRWTHLAYQPTSFPLYIMNHVPFITSDSDASLSHSHGTLSSTVSLSSPPKSSGKLWKSIFQSLSQAKLKLSILPIICCSVFDCPLFPLYPLIVSLSLLGGVTPWKAFIRSWNIHKGDNSVTINAALHFEEGTGVQCKQ